MKLTEFLIKAKKATYANEKAKERKLSDGTKELVYTKGKFLYRDRYFGFNPFSGQEVVFRNNKAVWMMNYYGKSFKNRLFTRKMYSFLRKALMNINNKSIFRGPKNFQEVDYKYVNKFQGGTKEFKGVEKIYYKNKLAYELNYHGGRL